MEGVEINKDFIKQERRVVGLNLGLVMLMSVVSALLGFGTGLEYVGVGFVVGLMGGSMVALALGLALADPAKKGQFKWAVILMGLGAFMSVPVGVMGIFAVRQMRFRIKKKELFGRNSTRDLVLAIFFSFVLMVMNYVGAQGG